MSSQLKEMHHYISENYPQLWQKAYSRTSRMYDGQHEMRSRAIMGHVIAMNPAAFAAACTAVAGI